jgi:hypothetical protein
MALALFHEQLLKRSRARTLARRPPHTPRVIPRVEKQTRGRNGPPAPSTTLPFSTPPSSTPRADPLNPVRPPLPRAFCADPRSAQPEAEDKCLQDFGQGQGARRDPAQFRSWQG